MKPPSWVTPNVMETLEVLKNFGFQIMFGVYKRKEKSRLQGGKRLERTHFHNSFTPLCKRRQMSLFCSVVGTEGAASN